MAARHDVSKKSELGGFRSGTALKKAALFLATLLGSLVGYIVTGYLLLVFFIRAGGSERIFLATLAFHALVAVAGSALLARRLTAPAFPTATAMASIIAIAWVALWAQSGPIDVPNPSTKPGDRVERTPPEDGPWTIEEARRFKEFTLYWVGEEFRGLSLTQISRFRSAPEAAIAANHFRFTYGTCRIPGGFFGDGGCGPPIQITVEPYCLDAYRHRVYYPDKVPFRGEAEASAAGEGAMYVWTGDVAVRISAHGQSGGPRAVAEALVSVNGLGPANAGGSLPQVSVDC